MGIACRLSNLWLVKYIPPIVYRSISLPYIISLIKLSFLWCWKVVNICPKLVSGPFVRLILIVVRYNGAMKSMFFFETPARRLIFLWDHRHHTCYPCGHDTSTSLIYWYLHCWYLYPSSTHTISTRNLEWCIWNIGVVLDISSLLSTTPACLNDVRIWKIFVISLPSVIFPLGYGLRSI